MISLATRTKFRLASDARLYTFSILMPSRYRAKCTMSCFMCMKDEFSERCGESEGRLTRLAETAEQR